MPSQKCECSICSGSFYKMSHHRDNPNTVQRVFTERQKALRSENANPPRVAICPHCQTRWTWQEDNWFAVIKRHGNHCSCPDNWKCTICKALILNPMDFAEYTKNGAHVACAEKELTGIEHFPPQLTQAEKEELQTEERWGPPPEDDSYEPICEEWSHGWTNTETGVECARCGVRRGTCPECGHDEHGAVCPSPCLCMLQIKKIARAEYRKSTCENCGNVLTISDPNRFTDGEAILCGRCE